MKQLVILGAGTGGTIVANKMVRRLPADWAVTVVDPDHQHLYQPGLLFLPFGIYDESKLYKPRRRTLDRRVQWEQTAVDAVDLEQREVVLLNGDRLHYDLLVIATGSQIRPEETEGLLGPEWRKSVHDFYTIEGAQALRSALASFRGGRIVVNIVDNPIKCPVAPLEFVFLADDFFRKKGMRDGVEIVFATPLEGCFTKPIASRKLKGLVEAKGIDVEPEFNIARVDTDRRVIESWDERRIDFDLLVSIPIHSGAPFIGKSGLGNDLNFVPTDRATLAVKGYDNIFAIGDVTDLPTSKAGSVAHFEADVLAENLIHVIRGESLDPAFDGHANCFIETGDRKALLIDFNYDTEPLPGRYPLPVVGPMSLLGESQLNHAGKLAFRWLYWNALLPGRPLPVPNRMSLRGKQLPEVAAAHV